MGLSVGYVSRIARSMGRAATELAFGFSHEAPTAWSLLHTPLMCLAKLPEGGSGTLFVEGSHRLVEGLCESEGVEKLKSADA